MLEENKNLKSHVRDISSPSLQGDGPDEMTSSFSLSYTKTNKLISALYMVTDIMDKEEPLRNKLRNLGANIVSDIHSSNKGQNTINQLNNKISEVLSFMEIAFSIGVISEMNSNILTKEFFELKKSVLNTIPKKEENWLQEFLLPHPDPILDKEKGREISIGHSPTRIGVQKGSTLLEALSRVGGKTLSDRVPNTNYNKNLVTDKQDVLKNKRREEIILVIKDKMKSSINFDGVTITDIKTNGHEALSSCGEKTLQRELVSMVSAGLLKKIGEKRWSRYSIS